MNERRNEVHQWHTVPAVVEMPRYADTPKDGDEQKGWNEQKQIYEKGLNAHTCVKSPNDPKLSDRGVRRGTCTAGGKAAAEAGAVTHGAVRCSAWLGRVRIGVFRVRLTQQRVVLKYVEILGCNIRAEVEAWQ